MDLYDDFADSCRRELDRHEQRLRTDDAYLWGYLASWFKECDWPDGTSDDEKLAVLEYLLRATDVKGHVMAIQEAIRRLRGHKAGRSWDDDSDGGFAAAVAALSQTYCHTSC